MGIPPRERERNNNNKYVRFKVFQLFSQSYELLEKLRHRKIKELEYHKAKLAAHQKALARAEREMQAIQDAEKEKLN